MPSFFHSSVGTRKFSALKSTSPAVVVAPSTLFRPARSMSPADCRYAHASERMPPAYLSNFPQQYLHERSGDRETTHFRGWCCHWHWTEVTVSFLHARLYGRGRGHMSMRQSWWRVVGSAVLGCISPAHDLCDNSHLSISNSDSSSLSPSITDIDLH